MKKHIIHLINIHAICSVVPATNDSEVVYEEAGVNVEEAEITESLERLSQVKGITEIRSSLKQMVNKAKAASNLNTHVQTLTSENESLRHMLGKSMDEQKSWSQKEAEMR